MADDVGFKPLEQEPVQKADDVGFKPIPKIPDMSDVQKMAQDNLAANDNKKVSESGEPKPAQSPMERTNIAAGFPVDKVISGTAKPEDFNAQHRAQYIKSLDNGSASDSGGWMQNYFHAVGNAIAGGGTRAVETLAYPFLSEESRQKLIESGDLGSIPDLTDDTSNAPKGELTAGNALSVARTGMPTPSVSPDLAAKGLTMANALLSPGVGALYTTIAAPISPVISPAIESAPSIAKELGVSEKTSSLIPAEIELAMNILGLGGLKGLHYPKPVLEAVAKKLNIDPSAVTLDHADQVIAHSAKDIFPAKGDFENVAAISGIPEPQLKTVFKETGVKPDQVFEDAQSNPDIVTDISAGKIPSQYEHLVAEKPAFSEEKTEALQVVRDEAAKSFSVVDKDGDHVLGGFDSAEEAQHYIEDEKFRAEERDAIENEPEITEKPFMPTKAKELEKLPVPIQAELDVAGKQGEQLAAANEGRLKPSVAQQAPSEGLFDVSGRGQKELFTPKPKAIPPSEIGRVTSLKQFLRNNGAKFDENNNLISMKGKDLDAATELAHEYGYTAERLSIPELQDLVKDNPAHTRMQDAARVEQARENAKQKQFKDPAFIEDQAHKAGIDTDPVKGETEKQRINRLIKALEEFHKSEEGYGPPDAIRQIIGITIQAVEKAVGKLTGNLFDRLADGYIKTFQPELAGDKALRADAYMAKYKAKLQEAQNSYYRASELEMRRWDRAGEDAQRQWLYDHETGRWSEAENPDHARIQAMYDAIREQEQNSGVGSDAYKENYLPHQYEKPEAVEKFFRSETMIKKYGKDWFNKASVFKLIQEADRAGFRLRTYNPERMLIARQQASYNMIATMDLLHDFEDSGMAKKATAFTIDKKISKTEQAISDIREKYKKQLADIETESEKPISAQMSNVQSRLADLNERLADFKQEKAENKLAPEQMTELKNGFRIIGPDSKAWIIHQQAVPLWENAMDMKDLYENQGLVGSAYRNYMAGKAVYIRTKMLASLFHPVHEIAIDFSSTLSSAAHHLIQGGKISDLLDKKMIPNIGLGKYTAKLQDNPQVTSWNTPAELRTPEQQAHVQRMVEGGFVPTVPRQDVVNFKENFNRAISGLGKNNLRLIGTALELPSLPLAPLMEHWIPGMKTESYFQRTDLALARDPSLAIDAGRRGEVFRQIAQDIERNYGEMNRNTQFWNPVVRDIFNATTFSGGWKLAMLQNFRGLLEPAKIAYNWAKTGEFSKEQITHQMLHSYIYTANMLMLGAGLNYLCTGVTGTLNDWINPQTGDKNPDGTPIRVRQPAFFNEPLMLMRDINQDGAVAGTGSFVYHQTLIPGIVDTLLGRDFVGRPYITDPTDLQQWRNMGWDSISPIVISGTESAESKGGQTAERLGWAGFGMAGAWVNQTPFEQKITAKYFEQNPSKDSALQAKLKAEMKGAVIRHDIKEQEEIEKEMKSQHMTSGQISSSKHLYTEKFSKYAWNKLSAEEQKRLIESASDEEKKEFHIKNH